LLRRAIFFRRELAGFVLLITFWAFSLNVLASGLFALLQKLFSAWVAKHIGVTVLLATAVFVLLSYLGACFLAWGLARTTEEIRRCVIVLPVLAHANGVMLAPIEGYKFGETLQLMGDPKDLLQSYRNALKNTPGRPLQDDLYRAVAEAAFQGVLGALAEECSFLLSRDAQFHGVDYSAIGDRSGACQRAHVKGTADRWLFLPHGYNAEVRRGPRDRYGKSAKEILIQGWYGEIAVSMWPQWAILGDYHRKSFELAKSKLRTSLKPYADRDSIQLPALWVIEIPVKLHASFQNFWMPWRFLSWRFEVYVAWIEDLLNRVEARIAWEEFVCRQEAGHAESSVGTQL
jgi:hypothetical protein